MNSDTVIYDYIICGGGCAGLSLAVHLCDPFFKDKSVLIIDKDRKVENDRTWCFWEPDHSNSFYENIVNNRWSKIRLAGHNSRITYDLKDWRYKRIRSIDFYNLAHQKIRASRHIDITLAEIQNVLQKDDLVEVKCDKQTYQGRLCFNSIPLQKLNPKEYELKQHFLGWEVEFDEEVLDPGVVDLMDFRMDQCDEVRFIYILPFSKKHGLIEMTIFSEEVFESKKQYEELLEDYLNSHFRNQKYRIIDTEYGIIPMSTHAYMGRNQDKIIPIGNLSGRIKPSSGYAFTRIQEEVKQIAKDLKTNNKRIGLDNQNRFLFYDRILFNVITRKRMLGADIFTRLFERNESVRVLTFLGEKTTLWQEIRIFNSLPFFPFFKAMLSEVIRRILYK